MKNTAFHHYPIEKQFFTDFVIELILNVHQDKKCDNSFNRLGQCLHIYQLLNPWKISVIIINKTKKYHDKIFIIFFFSLPDTKSTHLPHADSLQINLIRKDNTRVQGKIFQ